MWQDRSAIHVPMALRYACSSKPLFARGPESAIDEFGHGWRSVTRTARPDGEVALLSPGAGRLSTGSLNALDSKTTDLIVLFHMFAIGDEREEAWRVTTQFIFAFRCRKSLADSTISL
jgi:hypothetical protein